MTKYRININTGKTIEDNGNLGAFFFTSDWMEATTSEVTSINTEKLRKQKLEELKEIRNQYKCDNNCISDYKVQNALFGLGNFTDEERQSIRNFFEDLITKYDNFKSQIECATTQTDLNNIIINFED